MASAPAMLGRRVETSAVSVPGLSDELAQSSASLLSGRREEMKGRVQQHVLRAHCKFLVDEMGMGEVPVGAVPKAWHPKFDQAKVADIERTPLFPKADAAPSASPVPAQILDLIEGRGASTDSVQLDPAPAGTAAPSSASAALLERIRAKERQLQSRRIFGEGDAEAARELALIGQMDKFAYSVSCAFASTKRTTLFLADLTDTLIQSSSIAQSAAEVVERLKLLQRACPAWVALVDVNEMRTVKLLDRSFSLRQVSEGLAAYASARGPLKQQ